MAASAASAASPAAQRDVYCRSPQHPDFWKDEAAQSVILGSASGICSSSTTELLPAVLTAFPIHWIRPVDQTLEALVLKQRNVLFIKDTPSKGYPKMDSCLRAQFYPPPSCAAVQKTGEGKGGGGLRGFRDERGLKSPYASVSLLLCNGFPQTCISYFTSTRRERGGQVAE